MTAKEGEELLSRGVIEWLNRRDRVARWTARALSAETSRAGRFGVNGGRGAGRLLRNLPSGIRDVMRSEMTRRPLEESSASI